MISKPTPKQSPEESPLATVIEVTDDTIGRELREPVPVVLDFYADWCGPCKQLAPMLEDLAKKFAGKIKVLKANVEHNRQVQDLYKVGSLPTIIFGIGGDVLVIEETIVGLVPPPQLEQIVERLLEKKDVGKL